VHDPDRPMNNSIEFNVARKGLCSGCGVCAGLCPEKAIHMDWDEYGQYHPYTDCDKCSNCGSCLTVCPFWYKNKNESELSDQQFSGDRNHILGRYKGLYAGYRNDSQRRYESASGGMATWYLETLLRENRVDYAIAVKGVCGQNKLFEYQLIDDAEKVRSFSKSVYYPVELSEMISAISQKKARYAIVGLPCAIKAIRLAVGKNNVLNDRITMLVGLACGQQKNKYYAEYLCMISGGDPAKLKKVSFRVKDLKRHHLDHRFEWECEGGYRGSIYQSDGMSAIWGYDCFKVGVCNYCDDITAELADITFCDAIDERYSNGNAGANFIITRSELADEIMMGVVSSDDVTLRKVPLKALSDRHSKLVQSKREDLGYKLYRERLYNEGGSKIRKRVNAVKGDSWLRNTYLRLTMNLQSEIRRKSFSELRCLRNSKDITCVINKYRYKLVFIQKMMFLKDRLLGVFRCE
jgi:coenzyme F420 hydrogenase subunit beta